MPALPPVSPPLAAPAALPATTPPDDLRAALVATTVALLREQGPESLSLRHIARRLGVSSGAPYHHFADKLALLAAVALEGWEDLLARLTAVPAAGPPEERLRALGAAYVGFALERPEHYRVLFLPELKDPERHPALYARSHAALDHLVAVIASGLGRPAADPVVVERAIAAWSTVHGFALLSDGVLRARTQAGGAASEASRLAATVVDGAVRAALGAPPPPGGPS